MIELVGGPFDGDRTRDPRESMLAVNRYEPTESERRLVERVMVPERPSRRRRLPPDSTGETRS
ncbi:MAG: hypothetical protein JWM87_756 [Candidatus Eremiobacteraeota bacterium]|nr:hypothetical protein [Candidatus Eremiobacteraeota bacterium]